MKNIFCLKDAALEIKEWRFPSMGSLCNPSLVFGSIDSTPKVLVRGILPYKPFEKEFISSENHLLHLDENLNIASHQLLDESNLRKKFKNIRNGLEDGRLFYWKNELWALFSGYTLMGNQHINRMCMAKIIERQFSELIELPSPRNALREKNWMPWVIDDRLYFVYTISPLEVYEYRSGELLPLKSPNIQNRVHRSKTPFSGSSCIIPWRGRYLAVVHQRKRMLGIFRFWKKFISPDPLYQQKKVTFEHCFVILNSDFSIESRSKPFVFETKGIEFCAGLAHHEDRLLLSYGVLDCKAKCITIPASVVDSLFE